MNEIIKQGQVPEHNEEDEHDDGEEEAGWKSHWPLLLSLVILAVMLTLEFGFKYIPVFPIDLIDRKSVV